MAYLRWYRMAINRLRHVMLRRDVELLLPQSSVWQIASITPEPWNKDVLGGLVSMEIEARISDLTAARDALQQEIAAGSNLGDCSCLTPRFSSSTRSASMRWCSRMIYVSPTYLCIWSSRSQSSMSLTISRNPARTRGTERASRWHCSIALCQEVSDVAKSEKKTTNS